MNQFSFIMLPHHSLYLKAELSSLPTFSFPVSLDDDAFMKAGSIMEEQFPKDDDFGVLKYNPSLRNSSPLHFALQTPSFKGIFSVNFIFHDFVLVLERLN